MAFGIKHIEFWVSNLERSLEFYKSLFALIGWQRFDDSSFSCGELKIYFRQREVALQENIGPRHICFLAEDRSTVDKVGKWLKDQNSFIIRGPIESKYKNRASYTVDFKDPDGYILEVATKSEKI